MFSTRAGVEPVWQVQVRESGEVLLSHVIRADSFAQRFWGLMGRPGLARGEALWFPRTSSIHTFFMKFPLGIVYLNRDNQVVACEVVRPWRLGGWHRHTSQVVELVAELIDEVKIGTHWEFLRIPNES